MPSDTDSDVSAMSTSVPPGAGGLGNLSLLPPELRLIIYEVTLRRKKAVLEYKDPAWRSHLHFTQDPMKRVEFTDGLALLVASKRVYAEAMPAFFSCNTIKFINIGLHNVQNFPRLPYLKHMTIYIRNMCWPRRRAGSSMNMQNTGPIRKMFSDIKAFSHGSTSLKNIQISHPWNKARNFLYGYCHSFHELEEFRQPWLNALRHVLEEEEGVATAEDFLRETFGRDLVWQDEHLA